MSRGVSGGAVLVCESNIQGGLENCKVDSETPAGEGFGVAALLLVPSFQMKPAMKDGKPTRSAVRIPISFKTEGGGWSGQAVSMIAKPLWKSAPSFADMAAAWPRRAAGVTEAHVAMRCRVTKESRLSLCETMTETPSGKGFGSAARALGDRFELAVDPRGQGARRDIYVNVAVRFVDPNDAKARTVAHPRWIQGPDPSKILEIFPAEAIARGLTKGVGVADCLVAPDGGLTDCRPAREDPAGAGFAAAAVSIAGVMRMSPWTEDGRPVDGARIKLPIRFEKAPDTPTPAARAD